MTNNYYGLVTNPFQRVCFLVLVWNVLGSWHCWNQQSRLTHNDWRFKKLMAVQMKLQPAAVLDPVTCSWGEPGLGSSVSISNGHWTQQPVIGSFITLQKKNINSPMWDYFGLKLDSTGELTVLREAGCSLCRGTVPAIVGPHVHIFSLIQRF